MSITTIENRLAQIRKSRGVGALPTLEAVIDHYAAGGKMDHANKTRVLRPLQLTEGDKRDLVEFLKSLTDAELLSDPRWSDPWPAHGRR